MENRKGGDERIEFYKVRHGGGRRCWQDLHAYSLHQQHFFPRLVLKNPIFSDFVPLMILILFRSKNGEGGETWWCRETALFTEVV